MRKDSIDKIVKSYFAAVTKQRYMYKDVEYEQRTLIIHPSIASESICRLGCGACCYKFGLDYLPDEEYPDGAEMRKVEFNGSKFTIFTDFQEENQSKYCKHLSSDAMCMIHRKSPFTCDFELLKAYPTKKESRIAVVTFMNGHRMCRYPDYLNGARPNDQGIISTAHRPFCKVDPPSQKGAEETIRKLKRLQQWTDYFGIKTYIPEILRYLAGFGWKEGRATFGKVD